MKRRPYRMTARAAQAEATGTRIVDAALELFWAHPTDRFSLDEVAERAGVSVQTVIRRFGGRDGLMAAAVDRERARVAMERRTAAGVTPEEAVRQLVAHYERIGDAVLRLLAVEAGSPALRAIAEEGRAFHRLWCQGVFGAALGRMDPDTRQRRLAQLVAICDVSTWRLIRRDAGLDAEATELAVLELVTPLLEAP